MCPPQASLPVAVPLRRVLVGGGEQEVSQVDMLGREVSSMLHLTLPLEGKGPASVGLVALCILLINSKRVLADPCKASSPPSSRAGTHQSTCWDKEEDEAPKQHLGAIHATSW